MSSIPFLFVFLSLFLATQEKVEALAPGSSLDPEDHEQASSFYARLTKNQEEIIKVSFHIFLSETGEVRVVEGELDKAQQTTQGEKVFKARFQKVEAYQYQLLSLIPLMDTPEIPDVPGQEKFIKQQMKSYLRLTLGNDLIRVADHLIQQEGFPPEIIVYLKYEKVGFTPIDEFLQDMDEEMNESKLRKLANLPLQEESKLDLSQGIGRANVEPSTLQEPISLKSETKLESKPEPMKTTSSAAKRTESEQGISEGIFKPPDIPGAVRELVELEGRDELAPDRFDQILSKHRISGEPERTGIFARVLFKSNPGVNLRELLFSPQKKKGFLSRGKTKRPVDDLIGPFKLDEKVLLEVLTQLDQGEIPSFLSQSQDIEANL